MDRGRRGRRRRRDRRRHRRVQRRRQRQAQRQGHPRLHGERTAHHADHADAHLHAAHRLPQPRPAHRPPVEQRRAGADRLGQRGDAVRRRGTRQVLQRALHDAHHHHGPDRVMHLGPRRPVDRQQDAVGHLHHRGPDREEGVLAVRGRREQARAGRRGLLLLRAVPAADHLPAAGPQHRHVRADPQRRHQRQEAAQQAQLKPGAVKLTWRHDDPCAA
ncbi:hypothetical protein SBRY_20932 [Actinacidiphila bryophytorum]|uniref:Uncharacterized protein n=1 Tax=Actinacidiphila bryophytorum TaxID=1436133 RepID=A0A9W4E782_9ACTN|nr:hypothetical protein SBRY_20932 [Actinacidiphila bryophytorum]